MREYATRALNVFPSDSSENLNLAFIIEPLNLKYPFSLPFRTSFSWEKVCRCVPIPVESISKIRILKYALLCNIVGLLLFCKSTEMSP